MSFTVGRYVLVRYWRAHTMRQARPSRVIEDGERGLLVWLARGTPLKALVTADGSAPRNLAAQLTAQWRITDTVWRGEGVLQWFPPDGGAYSVWWFFNAGQFKNWYVNLEDPAARWSDGVDTSDHALDLVAQPDRSWSFKDEDEFAERTGHAWYWTPAEALAIRAQGERLARRIEQGGFPFDGTWCDFVPDPHWSTPDSVAPTWDEPQAA